MSTLQIDRWGILEYMYNFVCRIDRFYHAILHKKSILRVIEQALPIKPTNPNQTILLDIEIKLNKPYPSIPPPLHPFQPTSSKHNPTPFPLPLLFFPFATTKVKIANA